MTMEKKLRGAVGVKLTGPIGENLNTSIAMILVTHTHIKEYAMVGRG